MIDTYSFTVHGLPGPQGSKRHVGGGRMIESSKKVKPWREAVKWAAIEAMKSYGSEVPRLDGPLRVSLYFALPRPASAPKRVCYPAKKPDLDKLVRSTLDALTDSGIWVDDSRVVCLYAQKNFAGAEGRMASPGVLINIGSVTQ